jgi:hypothetical protein
LGSWILRVKAISPENCFSVLAKHRYHALDWRIANVAPHGMQGRVQGANQAQQSVARMLGPLMGALLYTLGPSIPYFAGAVLILIALATLFLPVTAIKASSLQGIDTA